MATVTLLGDTYTTAIFPDGTERLAENLRYVAGGIGRWWNDGASDDGDGAYYTKDEIAGLNALLSDGWRVEVQESDTLGLKTVLDAEYPVEADRIAYLIGAPFSMTYSGFRDPTGAWGGKGASAGLLCDGADPTHHYSWGLQAGTGIYLVDYPPGPPLPPGGESVFAFPIRLIRDVPEPTPTEESTMSQLDNIVSVTIDRQTQSVSQQSFGIPGVIGQFLTSKTTTAFTRAREYADLAEMLADGWTTSDAVYKAAAAIFRQNPTVPKIIVGRKDAADTDWGAALTAVNNENGDWYRFVIIPNVPATPNDEYLDAAEWTETQKKRLFIQTLETDTLNAALSTDLAAQLKALGYDRTVVQYHLAANTDEDVHASWVGEGSPFDPGSSTWAYKTLKGVTADKLTTAQKAAAWGKNCNTYTTVGGVSITEKGVVASGEFIDILDGIDWIESRLQETVFGSLVNLRKIPYDDSGIQMIRGLVKSVLDEAGRKGILQGDTIEVTAPKYKDIPSADRMARHLPDIKFTALLQGAIHTVAISGVVSV